MKLLTGFGKWFHEAKFEIFREILISIIISTAVTSLFSFYFDKKMDLRVSDRQFIYDSGRTFIDNPKYRNVSIAIEEQYIYGKEDKISSITEYDLDDYLGFLSDMWIYSREGYISKNLFENQYYYYLCVTYKSKLVREYREKLRKDGFTNDWYFLDEVNSSLKFDSGDCKSFN